MASNLALDEAQFEEKVLKSSVPVLVDFWAEWCGPCKMIGPSIEELATEYAGRAAVYKVDVDVNSGVAGQYGISSIPALLVFKDGKVAETALGARPKKDIAALIDRHL